MEMEMVRADVVGNIPNKQAFPLQRVRMNLTMLPLSQQDVAG